MPIEFFIGIEVVPKQSDRTRIVIPRDKKKKPFIHHYQPTEVTDNADALVALCHPHVPKVGLHGPVRLRMVVQVPWRLSEPKKNRTTAKPKDTWPDWDNYAKQMCDVLQRAGFFRNDGQIADAHVRKLWTDSPGAQVFMEEIE